MLFFACKTLVSVKSDLREFLCLGQKFTCFGREHLVQGCESDFTLQEVLELAPVRFLAVEGERILSFCLECRIVPVEMPVTAVDCEFLFLLAQTHACFQTMVDTWSVSDDERRSVVRLCFFQRIEELCRICTHGYLCYIYVTVADGHHSEVFLADSLS